MKTKELIIGILVGLLTSALGFVLALLIFGKGISLSDSLTIAVGNGVLTKLVSMGAILNLGAFFLFIKQDKDVKARGVLISTIIVACITLIVRFV